VAVVEEEEIAEGAVVAVGVADTAVAAAAGADRAAAAEEDATNRRLLPSLVNSS
jgi:hypothetical protein